MKLKKRLTYALCGALMLAMWSCNNDSARLNKRISELEQQNTKLQTAQANKDSSINQFLKGYDEIQQNLNVIKEKQKLVTTNISTSGDIKKKDAENDIVNDIKAINDLMEKNHKTINYLSKRLKNSNVKIKGLQKLLADLSAQIQQKDAQIADLQGQVTKLNGDLNYLFKEYNDRINELNGKDSTLDVAFYAYGTAKELKDEGVITKAGGFIGIGGIKKLKSDFNKKYFTQIDISQTTAIPLLAKKATVVTSHPKDSYKIVGNNKADSLVITDPKAFWSVSKYCVIVVQN